MLMVTVLKIMITRIDGGAINNSSYDDSYGCDNGGGNINSNNNNNDSNK